MLRTGWFTAVHVKSAESHKIKTLLGARDQLIRVKRSLGNQVRGLFRPFGVRLPSRAGMKKFAEAAEERGHVEIARPAEPNYDAGATASIGAMWKWSRAGAMTSRSSTA
jgi:transposase